MKTLYLLRHAKAESGTKDVGDLDRVLAPRGREACITVGAYMKEKGYSPDIIALSPSARTRETVERVLKAANLETPQTIDPKLYLATPNEIAACIIGLPESAASAMVVGHNPGMHHAALMYASTKRTELRRTLELKYPTAALTVLKFDCEQWNEIEPGDAELIDFITPGEL
jgi:phosphohistidine phosphatase